MNRSPDSARAPYAAIAATLMALLLVCLSGFAEAASPASFAPDPKPASGVFLINSSEVSGEIEAASPDGIGGKTPSGLDGFIGSPYCHNDPVGKYDRLGLDVPADKETALAKVSEMLQLVESVNDLSSTKSSFDLSMFGPRFYGTDTVGERQLSRQLDEAISGTSYLRDLSHNEVLLYQNVVSKYPEGTLSDRSFQMLNEAAINSTATGAGLPYFAMGEGGNLFVPEGGALSSATLLDPLAVGVATQEIPAEMVWMGVDQLPMSDTDKTKTMLAANVGLILLTKKVPTGVARADDLAVLGRRLERLGYDQANTTRILQSIQNGEQVVIIGENMKRVSAVSRMVERAGGRAVTYSPRNFRSKPGIPSRLDLDANRSWIRYWGKDKGVTTIDIGRQPIPRVSGPSPFYGIENRSLNRWGIYTPFGN